MTLFKAPAIFTVAFVYATLLVNDSTSAQNSPVMEYSSVLTSLDVYHHDGRLQIEDDNAALSTVFLPAGAKVDIVISAVGSDQPLHIQPMSVSQPMSVFNRVEARGNLKEFKFAKPGDYIATYRANGKPITVVPFSIEFQTNDDQFDPKTHVYANGPWSQFAYLFASVNAGPDANPEIRFWVRKKSFLPNPDADRYTVELRKAGDVVAVSEGGSSNSKKWQFMRLRLKHPESKGGQSLKLKELVDGQYDVLIKRNENAHAAFRFRVNGGKPMWHPRQASDFKPRTQYIVPRFPGILGAQGDASAGNMFWMERLSDSDAASIASSTPAAKTISDEDRARWAWLPRSIDPNRPFKLSITKVETRNDTGIAVGEDLIAFGTGFPTGVKYMKVGDTQPREIPGGETYNSKVFGVCGSKIVLVKKTQVVIFDTKTSKLTAIPETDVSLYNVGQQLLATNGFLIGTASRATAVTDRTIIKVIDVSNDVPRIIPIKNADYLDSDVTALSLDAGRGTMAISVRQKKLIAAAKIAPLANQHVFDMSDYRGVGPQQIFIEGDWVTYADEDWKVRLLDLEKGKPKAMTDQAFPRSGNGFFVRKGRLTVATTSERVGSRYRIAIGDLPGSPRVLASTGTSIVGTSGSLGMGGSAAISLDKTVFIAGTPGDSIGVGEHLQVLNGEQWTPIVGSDNKPVPASDVTTSIGLLAFKSLTASGQTVIGYATYGQRVNYQPGSPAADNSKMATASPNSGPLKPIQFEAENIYNTKDEMDEAALVAMLENESTMLAAFTQAFGEEAAKKRVIEQVVTAFKAQKAEHLIDEYKRRSKCIAEKEKPKATTTQSDADPRSVEAALSGQWQPLRFVANGQELPDEMIEAVRLTFAAGKYVMVMGGEIETGTYTINTKVLPHQITISIGAGKNAGQVRHGVFKLLENNQLLAAYATNETDQPFLFTSTESNKQLLAAYKRGN